MFASSNITPVTLGKSLSVCAAEETDTHCIVAIHPVADPNISAARLQTNNWQLHRRLTTRMQEFLRNGENMRRCFSFSKCHHRATADVDACHRPRLPLKGEFRKRRVQHTNSCRTADKHLTWPQLELHWGLLAAGAADDEANDERSLSNEWRIVINRVHFKWLIFGDLKKTSTSSVNILDWGIFHFLIGLQLIGRYHTYVSKHSVSSELSALKRSS